MSFRVKHRRFYAVILAFGLAFIFAADVSAQSGPPLSPPGQPGAQGRGNLEGVLPDPDNQRDFRAISAGYSADGAGGAIGAVEDFLLDQGEEISATNALNILSEEVSAFSGRRIVEFGQEVGGLRIFGASAKAVFGPEGDLELLTANLSAADGPTIRAVISPRFALDATLAELHPGKGVGLAERGRSGAKISFDGDDFFHNDPTVERVLLPGPGKQLAEGFLVETWTSAGNQLNNTLIDGRGARVAVMNLTSNDSYNVFLENPDAGPQVVRPGVAGWLGAGTQYETRIIGNNTDVRLDREDDDIADPTSTTVVSGDFLSVWDGAKHPTDGTSDNDAVAVQNLFYLTNWIHDTLYTAGFTETAGNFQTDNFGLGGLGVDPVLVDGQDGADLIAGEAAGGGPLYHLNNANFATPFADGVSPRMQMYLWGEPNSPLPPTDVRDGALEADVVWHEYGHGLTTRIHGLNMLGTMGGAIGEGSSDVLSVVAYNQDTLGEWAYRTPAGVRLMPYDDYRQNTRWVWNDNNSNGEYDPGVDTQVWPTGRTYDGVFGSLAILGIHQPHFEGELYGAIMWDMWTRYRDEGDAAAVPADDDAARALLLAEWVEGMKVTTYSNPPLKAPEITYPDARDGLLYAISGDPDISAVPTDAAVRTRWCHAWNAFADIGVGLDQTTGYYGSGAWSVSEGFARPTACDAVAADHARPEASFTQVCTGRNCAFTDTSTDTDGSVVGWSWEFDDGSRSTEKNPVHLFPEDDGFGVVLRVFDDGGLSNMVQQDVTVTGGSNTPPVAAFTESCTDLTCDFTDLSTDSDGSVTTWSWDFGNGFSTTNQNPSIAYAAAGTYLVSLSITDNLGAGDSTSHDVVVVDVPNVNPTAAFAYVCADFACDFTNSSTDSDGVIVLNTWDFGNGFGATDASPSYTYPAAGTYTVVLEVIDDEAGTDSTSQLVTVPVVVNAPPVASFSYSCTDLDCAFTDTSTDSDGTVVGWNWAFGDGITSTLQSPSYSYAAAGTYTVMLTATDDGGASNAVSQSVTVTEPNVAPVAAFSYVCTDLSCTFTDTSTDDGNLVSWNWDFGDGSTSTAQNPSHDFAAGGTFTVGLTVTDDDGATNATSQNVTVTAPVGNTAPVADAQSVTTVKNTAVAIVLTGSDADGDGLTFSIVSGPANGSLSGSGANQTYTPNKQYFGADSFAFLVNDGTENSAIATVSIEVLKKAPPGPTPPTAGFNYSCTGMDCSFTDTSSDDGTVIGWSWGFGDGGTSASQNPSHSYAVDGTYTVILTVTDNDGQIDATSQSVIIGASGGVTLATSPYKVKGVQHVDLTWSGAMTDPVEIFRDGGVIATTANDGAYTDNINAKGGGSYTYQVCETGASPACSAVVNVVF